MTAGRRSFLKGALTAGVAGVASGATSAGAPDATGARDGRAGGGRIGGGRVGGAPSARRFPFHGTHQAGITTPQQRQVSVVVFDVIADGRDELAELLRAVTARAAWLTAGGTPADPGITAPPADSGVLGRTFPPDGLTVTVGVGESLFDGRYGLARRKPARLRRMRTFPNDDLDPAYCHGDLSLQLCANNTDTVLHALRDIARHTRGAMQIKYRMDGFVSPPRPSGTPRNLLGFKDGTSNPETTDRAQMDRLVWVRAGGDEPSWTRGGSYQVIRLIRMRVEFWDRVSLSEQENIIGRRRDSGAPLDGTHEFDTPHYARDPIGQIIPLTSHIRRANPRTPQSADSFFLRRPYNYDRGTDSVGDLDMGLIFIGYQQDLRRQFETVQRRLIDEPLVDYVTPFGGGYFFVLPGVADSGQHLGSRLLA